MNNFKKNGPLSKQEDSLDANGCKIKQTIQPMFPMIQLQMFDQEIRK